jgi:hypothetical protein
MTIASEEIAAEIAENEVERRIGKWLRYSEEAQDLYNECYDEALAILNRHLKTENI